MNMKKFIVAMIASSVVLTGCSSADNSVDLNVSEFSAKSQEAGVISMLSQEILRLKLKA
jgi:major membrane immunogen (membrane-anchored lipoprotein)